MGKEQKKMALGETSFVFLFILTCLYAALFTSNLTPFESCNFLKKPGKIRYGDFESLVHYLG